MALGKAEQIMRDLYNRLLRPHLPYKISVHNGIAVKNHSRLLDVRDQFPRYEQPLISTIRHNIKNQNNIVLVGGGLGVSTVATVEAMGRQGVVVTYEGSASQYKMIQNTLELNKIKDYVDLNHAIVGSYSDYSTETYGKSGNADIIDPSTLPECDVLILDCEGAELDIIEKLSFKPNIIIVETHEFLGSPEKEVKKLLKNIGYKIINRGVESEQEGVFVLTAVR